jgi:hypothetical protein
MHRTLPARDPRAHAGPDATVASSAYPGIRLTFDASDTVTRIVVAAG